MSAERACLRSLKPLLEAGSMKNMSAFKFLDDLVLTETLNADGAGSGAFLHYKGLNFDSIPVDFGVQDFEGGHLLRLVYNVITKNIIA